MNGTLIAASAEDAERMLADWETESRIVREHSETSAGSGGRPRVPAIA